LKVHRTYQIGVPGAALAAGRSQLGRITTGGVAMNRAMRPMSCARATTAPRGMRANRQRFFGEKIDHSVLDASHPRRCASFAPLELRTRGRCHLISDVEAANRLCIPARHLGPRTNRFRTCNSAMKAVDQRVTFVVLAAAPCCFSAW